MRTDPRRSDLALYDTIPNLGRGGFGPEGLGMPAEFSGAAASDHHSQSLWSLIDDRMRGRWKWAILIGLALSLILGVLGYFTGKPMFESVGLVRISPQPGIVETVTPEIDSYTKNYDRNVATQMQYMKSQRCLQQALRDEELMKLPFAAQSSAMKVLREGLHVAQDRDSEFVYVSFESEDPDVAVTSVNAVLRAYDSLFAKDGGGINATIDELNDSLKQQTRELNSRRTQHQSITGKYDTFDLKSLDVLNRQRIAELENQVRMGRGILQRVTASQKPGESGVTQILPDESVLDRLSSRLASLRAQRDQAQNDFDDAAGRYLQGTEMYKDKEAKKLRAEALYRDEYEKTLVKWQSLGSGAFAAKGVSEILTPDDLAAREKDLAGLKENQQKLVSDMVTIDDLTYEESQLQKGIDRTSDRIRSLQTEKGRLTSVITVANWGARPDEPSNDARRRRGIIGVGLGMMASFGSFFLLGTIDRRAFGASQLSATSGHRLPACLGVLPDLGASLTDPETSDVASHCVHQIRNQIEALRDPRSGYVLAITSPFQGDGKTSIVMALGWSYAAAGFNTLLIDCDMVGRSLTRQLGLVGREGLKDALVERQLNGSVTRLPVEHLSAIPVGLDARFGPENVRRSDLDKLLDQVRDKFDIILIDTGPMLGALESTPVSAVADGVVLSVRRGRSRARLEDCVNRLGLVGTKCVGVILNCAVRSDCNRYVSEASLAAAEEDRAGRGSASTASIVQVSPGDRNALMRAMQDSARTRNSDR